MVTVTLDKPWRRTLPWVGDVVGEVGSRLLAVEQGSEAGTTFAYQFFSSTVDDIITIERSIVGSEEVELLDGTTRRLCHVAVTYSSIPNVEIDLWCDQHMNPIKSQLKAGRLVFAEIRTTEERALGTQRLAPTIDAEALGDRCEVDIPSLLTVDSILYRLVLRDSSLGFPQGLSGDHRQTILERGGQIITLLVEEVAPPGGEGIPSDLDAEKLREFLEPTPFIQSDHLGLKSKAVELVAGRTVAWEAVCLLARFVHEHLSNNDTWVGYASAAWAFERGAGDCTEHSVLLTAMARAVGVPSRVVTGYLYEDGAFWAHAWTEVWIGGTWYAIDSTVDGGLVSPGHIRFSVQHDHPGTEAFTLMDNFRGANVDVEIVEFTCGERKHNAQTAFLIDHVEGASYRSSLFGIGLTKPPEYEFQLRADVPFNEDPTLVTLVGQSMYFLSAGPPGEDYSATLVEKGWKILSQCSQPVGGVNGTAYKLEARGLAVNALCLRTTQLHSFSWGSSRTRSEIFPSSRRSSGPLLWNEGGVPDLASDRCTRGGRVRRFRAGSSRPTPRGRRAAVRPRGWWRGPRGPRARAAAAGLRRAARSASSGAARTARRRATRCCWRRPSPGRERPRLGSRSMRASRRSASSAEKTNPEGAGSSDEVEGGRSAAGLHAVQASRAVHESRNRTEAATGASLLPSGVSRPSRSGALGSRSAPRIVDSRKPFPRGCLPCWDDAELKGSGPSP